VDQDPEEGAVMVVVAAAAAVVVMEVAAVAVDTDPMAVETDRTISRYLCIIIFLTIFDICLQVWTTRAYWLSSTCGESVKPCQLASMCHGDCAMCVDVCVFHSGLMGVCVCVCVCGFVCV